jgi:hypothetical protein
VRRNWATKRSFRTIFRGCVGFSDGAIPDDNNSWIGGYPNSYAIHIANLYVCNLAGQPEPHYFELPEGAIRPSWKCKSINVFGCGLVLDSEDKLCIFFTLNGKLMSELVLEDLWGKQKSCVLLTKYF